MKKMKRWVAIAFILVLCCAMVYFMQLHTVPEMVDYNLALEIGDVLIRDQFNIRDDEVLLLKAERKGYNWYVHRDSERYYYDEIYAASFINETNYEVIIRGRDGKIKSIKGLFTASRKDDSFDMISRDTARQIAELLLREKLNPNETYRFVFNTEKKNGDWHIQLDSEKSELDVNFQTVIRAKDGKIKRITMPIEP